MATSSDWDLYRTFLAVAEEGSFTRAAQWLLTTQPTVGRQIAALEASLDTKLFTRSTRGLELTDAGRDLKPHVEAMEQAAAAARRDCISETGSNAGVVRLAAGDLVGVEVLPPILADFCGDHPEIEVELVLSNRNEDLLRRGADVAIRMARPTQKALVARRIGTVGIGLFAHRRYVERFGVPTSLNDIGRHRIIGFDQDFHVLMTNPGGPLLRREDFNFRTDNVAAQLAALRAGIGIGAVQTPIAQRDPDLAPVLANAMRFEREMWLVMHEDQARIRRIRLLFDALAKGLSDYLR